MTTIELHEFARVGYHLDPFNVTLEYQDGHGRFDDPQRERVVIYGADTVRTCLYELVMPWQPGEDDYVNDIRENPDPDEGGDPELLEQISRDAARDRVIAQQRRQMPKTLYEKAKVHARLEPAARLVNLNLVQVRQAMVAAIPDVRVAMAAARLRQFDKSVMLSQHLDITRAVSGHLMRNDFEGQRHDGLCCDSRHDGTNYILFEGRFRFADRTDPVRLSPDDEDVRQLAAELGWAF